MPSYKSIYTSVGYHAITAPLIRAARRRLVDAGSKYFKRSETSPFGYKFRTNVRPKAKFGKMFTTSMKAHKVTSGVQSKTQPEGYKFFKKDTIAGRSRRKQRAEEARQVFSYRNRQARKYQGAANPKFRTKAPSTGGKFKTKIVGAKVL